MLSMSHIPTRVAVSGFASTVRITLEQGWSAQRLAPFVEPLGMFLNADAFRLTLPSADASINVRAEHPIRRRATAADGTLRSLQRLAQPTLEHAA